MARKFIYKHRRGLAEDWKRWLTTGENKLENGEIGIIDSDPGDNPNHLRLLVGDGEQHPYEEMPKFAYAQEENNSVVSKGYDYAEYFKWADDVPESHRQQGLFVTIAENTRTIRPAQPDDKVLGITSHTASIIGNWDEGNRAASDGWAIVGMLGIIEVKHDHTCVKNGYAMIGADGVATHTDEPFGYKIVKVNDEAGTIEVVLGNNSDMVSRMKIEINDLKEEMSAIDSNFDDINVDIGRVESIAKGRATGYVFDTLVDLDAWLADSENTVNLNLGDNLYIRATDVPDYWWDGDKKQQLETQKVDLTEYVKNTDYASESRQGVSKVVAWGGTAINNSGQIYLVKATNAEIDARETLYKPIVPSNLEYAVKSVGDGYYATEKQIGDISAALDELHTYAQALVGGDA